MPNIHQENAANSINSSISPEIFLLDLVRRLEEELQKKTQESTKYREQCIDLKKQLRESDSIKQLLYNYVIIQKKNLNKDFHGKEPVNSQITSDQHESHNSTSKEEISENPTSCEVNTNKSTPITLENNNCISIINEVYEKFKKSLKRVCLKLKFRQNENIDSFEVYEIFSLFDSVVEHINIEKNNKSNEFYLNQVEYFLISLLSEIENFYYKAEEQRKLDTYKSKDEYSSLKISFMNGIKNSVQKSLFEFNTTQFISGLDKILADCEKLKIENIDEVENMNDNVFRHVKNELYSSKDSVINSLFLDINSIPKQLLVHNSSGSLTDRILLILDEFLLDLVLNFQQKYKIEILNLSESQKIYQREYSSLLATIENIYALCSSESDDQNLIHKLRTIEQFVRECVNLKNDQLSHENLRKAIIFITSKLDDYLEHKHKDDSNGFDQDTADIVHKIVSSFNEILDTFSRKPIDLADEIVHQLESYSSVLTENLDASQKSLSNKMRDLKNLVNSLKVSDDKNKKEVQKLSELLIKSEERIQKLEEDIENQSTNTTLNSDILSASAKVACVADTILKYSQDLLSKGIKIKEKNDKQYSPENSGTDNDDYGFDEDLERINENIDLLLGDKDIQDENTNISNEALGENILSPSSAEDKSAQIDVNFKIKQLQDATQDLYKLNLDLNDSKSKFENDQSLNNKKVDTLVKSMMLYSTCKENQSSSQKYSKSDEKDTKTSAAITDEPLSKINIIFVNSFFLFKF